MFTPKWDHPAWCCVSWTSLTLCRRCPVTVVVLFTNSLWGTGQRHSTFAIRSQLRCCYCFISFLLPFARIKFRTAQLIFCCPHFTIAMRAKQQTTSLPKLAHPKVPSTNQLCFDFHRVYGYDNWHCRGCFVPSTFHEIVCIRSFTHFKLCCATASWINLCCVKIDGDFQWWWAR